MWRKRRSTKATVWWFPSPRPGRCSGKWASCSMRRAARVAWPIPMWPWPNSAAMRWSGCWSSIPQRRRDSLWASPAVWPSICATPRTNSLRCRAWSAPCTRPSARRCWGRSRVFRPASSTTLRRRTESKPPHGFRSQPAHHAGEQKHQKSDVVFHPQALGEKPAQAINGKGINDDGDKKSGHGKRPEIAGNLLCRVRRAEGVCGCKSALINENRGRRRVAPGQPGASHLQTEFFAQGARNRAGMTVGELHEATTGPEYGKRLVQNGALCGARHGKQAQPADHRIRRAAQQVARSLCRGSQRAGIGLDQLQIRKSLPQQTVQRGVALDDQQIGAVQTVLDERAGEGARARAELDHPLLGRITFGQQRKRLEHFLAELPP